ncbi:MAG: NAD(P)-dependent oxidoreductase [Lacipirellulaceae bacterium]
MPTPLRVAFLGLGIMGGAMARNLVRGGLRVTVWNRSPGKTRPLADEGATVVASPAEAVDGGCDLVCVCVTDTPDVEQVLFGPAGVASAAPKSLRGLVVVDHSTISPDATRGFAARLATLGATLLDAPVTGGDVGARAGTLTIMVGGEADALRHAEPALRLMGKSIVHLGPCGSGQACKACNQVAAAAALVGACEALALAKRSGLDLRQVVEVVSSGAAGSWQLANLGPKIAAGDHAPGFMIDLLLKDLRIVGGASDVLSLPMPVTRAAEALFKAAQAAGHGVKGTQAVSAVLERLGRFRFADERA